MKIKEGFVLREMGGQAVVVSVGPASKVFNGMIKLNDTGEFLWNELKSDKSEEELVESMLAQYDVSEEVARQGVDNFIATLKSPGIIE